MRLSGEAPAQGGRRALILDLPTPGRVLSSAVRGGGLATANWIAALSVPRDWAPPTDRLDAEIDDRLAALGLAPGGGVVLLTAVDVAHVHVADETAAQHRLRIVATVGIGNAVAAGRTAPHADKGPGTINLIVVYEGALSDAALVGAVQTATEAKAAALFDGGVRTPEGWPASGTSTDTVTVICLSGGPGEPWAGPITPVGAAIGRGVRRTVGDALLAAGRHV